MIEHEGKKYYTTYELLDFIRDKEVLGEMWSKVFPLKHKVILLEHITRVLSNAKMDKKIKFLEYKKNEKSSKTFYAYSIEDVRDFLKSYKKEVYDVKIHEKE